MNQRALHVCELIAANSFDVKLEPVAVLGSCCTSLLLPGPRKEMTSTQTVNNHLNKGKEPLCFDYRVP